MSSRFEGEAQEHSVALQCWSCIVGEPEAHRPYFDRRTDGCLERVTVHVSEELGFESKRDVGDGIRHVAEHVVLVSVMSLDWEVDVEFGEELESLRPEIGHRVPHGSDHGRTSPEERSGEELQVVVADAQLGADVAEQERISTDRVHERPMAVDPEGCRVRDVGQLDRPTDGQKHLTREVEIFGLGRVGVDDGGHEDHEEKNGSSLTHVLLLCRI